MCRKKNVMHRMCPTDHQAMNGQVDRAQSILAAKTRALLMDSGMEKSFWPLAMDTATYLINRTPHDWRTFSFRKEYRKKTRLKQD